MNCGKAKILYKRENMYFVYKKAFARCALFKKGKKVRSTFNRQSLKDFAKAFDVKNV